jgi:tetratricopeptide (TPR) repeat protein
MAVLALLLLGAAAYVVPQLFQQPGFVDYVDAPLRDGGTVATASVLDIFAGRLGDAYAPVAWLSFRLDHAMVGDSAELAGVMHLHSVLLHLSVSVVLLVLLCRLRVQPIRAMLGAGLFVVHPAVFETASVIAFRPAILAALFSLLAVFFAVRRLQTGGRAQTWAAVSCAALAVGSLPLAAFALPVLGYVVGWWGEHRGRATAVRLGVPAAVVFCLGAWLQGLPFYSFTPVATLDPVLAVLWPRTPAMVFGPVLDPSVAAGVASVAVMLAIGGIALIVAKRAPGVATGLTWVAVACVLGGLGGEAQPDLAGYLAVAGGAFVVASFPIPRGAMIAIGSVAALGLVVFDLTLAPWYDDGADLWRDVADRSPVAAVLLAQSLAESRLDDQRREALAHLLKALPRLPENATRLRALETQVRLYANLGQTAEASRTAESLCVLAEGLRKVVSDERMLGYYLRTAECFSVENSRTKIDEYFDKARKLAPTHPSVVAADAEQMYVKLVHAVRRERDDPDVDVKPGWLRSDEARLGPITSRIDEALAKDSRCYRALILKGRIAEAMGGVLSAVPLYESAIEAGPKRAEARILLATLYVANELPEAAEQCVKKALLDGVDDPSLHYLLGNIYAVQGRRDDARRYLEAYLGNRPGNRDAMILLANLLSAEALSKRDRIPVGELKEYADRIRLLNVDDPKGWMVQAAVLCKSRPRKFIEAIVLLEKALRKMPENPGVKRQLACAHRDYGWMLTMTHRDTAMDHFKTFLEIAPRDVAVDAVRKAVRSHCKTLERSGRERLRAGEAAVAEASFGRSAFLSPDRPDAFFQLGLARMNQEKLDEALDAFENALRLGRKRKQDVSHFLLPLLDILQRVGRADDAKRRGEEFLANPGDADQITVDKIRALLK